jgi:electron transfer flavoprotein alpha subunit
MNKYLVFLEQRGGTIKKASIKTWNRVQELAAEQGDSAVFGILAGPADLKQLDGHIAGEGVIFHASEEGLALYNPERYARLVKDTLQREACTTLFFADTILSRELAPKLSVCLKASLLSGCAVSDVARHNGGCVRPVYAGSAMASFFPERTLRIYTISSCATPAISNARGTITVITLEPHSFASEPLFPVVRRIMMREGVLDVAEAGIIVAGGRGMGGTEGFFLLEQLALLLGGAVGASRPVVDEGWRPQCEQIGQTGKTVAPVLYFAFGISGSLQHLAGIGSAGTVVAINKDCHAPIFDVADYGIVGDVHLVLPKLLDTLQEFLKRK